MKTIFDFKKGDRITRVKPSEGVGDRSYIGTELIFVGIANAKIYFKMEGFSIAEDAIYSIDLDLFVDGWEEYVDPQSLLQGSEEVIDRLSIEKQIERAIEREDYELAARLLNKLDKENTLP